MRAGFTCPCGWLYCALHWYSNEHNCVFDYHSLRANDSLIKEEKVQKILALVLKAESNKINFPFVLLATVSRDGSLLAGCHFPTSNLKVTFEK